MTSRRTYVIAEAGVNHDGKIDDALDLIDAAAEAGANCVKFQTFRAEQLASERAEKAEYQKRSTETDESQRAMLRRLELPQECYPRLVERARERNIAFLSTPFDRGSLDFLMRNIGLTRIKIGSGDLTNAPLLFEVARAKCAVVLSAGMATLGEVEEALSVLAFGYSDSRQEPSRAAFAAAWADPTARALLADRVVLLHCTTEYPAPPATANLKAMDTLSAAFGLPTGFSDHTLGAAVAVAAVARGAVMIEKHLTLDRTRAGPDHAASLDPRDFRDMVDAIRCVEAALGDGRKVPQAAELKNMPIARKALVAARPIAKGETFDRSNVTVKRPASGLSPFRFWDVMGRTAERAYQIDEPIEL